MGLSGDINMSKFIALLLVCSFASAQGTLQLPDIGQSTSHTLEGWKIRVDNQYTASIVAIHVYLRCPTTAEHARFGYQFQYDHLFNYGSDKPIAPGGFVELPLPKAPTDCAGGLDAVVFADGHTNGDPEAVQDIYRRRRGIAEALSFALPLVGQVALTKLEPGEAAKALRDKSKTESLDSSKSGSERLGERYVLLLVARLLEKQHDLLVPSDSTPKKQAGIDETMQTRQMTSEEAHATVLKRKLEEWESDLQGKLGPQAGK
jgi:hypothetical protein